MKKIALTITVLSSIIVTGCSYTDENPLPNPAAEIQKNVSEDMVEQNQTIRAQARLTKGDQIVLNDIFLSQEQVQLTGLSETMLDGKTVEILGDVVTEYCSIYDQCISGEDGNYLKYFRNVKYIKIINE